MAEIKFYTDEHIGRAVVNGLRQRSINVLTCQEADLRSASDEEHLKFAKKEKRVIFSQDNDFLKLHALGKEHTDIVYARQGTPIGKIIKGLVLIHQILEAKDMVNHVEFI